jgi:SAM-dependent methyltransferase
MVDVPLQAYYARDEERDRLSRGVGRVELARTIEVLQRTLPPPGARVADIGGGPGRYTDWLVDAGYEVVHRDVVALHVEQVRARHGARVDAAVGDATALDLPDGAFDAVLLLGPLYHLTDEVGRRRALREARRIVRDGGVVYAAAISRWAPRLNGMLVDRLHLEHPEIVELVDEVERSGLMPPVHEASFTGYAHTPEQLRDEVEESGLEVASLVAVEGIAFALADLDARMDDPAERALLLDVLRAVESVPALLGVGPHLLVTAHPRPPTRR